MTKVYLGEGVYINYDGSEVTLTTENNTIYLNQSAQAALLMYFKEKGIELA